MILFQAIGFVLLTLAPGLVAVRLLRNKELHGIDAILYSVGFGLVFNLIVGLIASFTFGIELLPVLIIYIVLLGVLGLLSWKFGISPKSLEWRGWKPLTVPLAVYIVAVVLQLQTTLVSVNLVGSDIHLEYFYANMTLEDGYWNPLLSLTYMTSAIGINVLLPVYKLLTGMELMWVFKVITPMMFAVVPLALYRIFKMQFGTLVAVLSTIFFVTMPMYTMDMTQLVRQGQSELFFVLVIVVALDDNLGFRRKLVLGGLFSISAVIMHYGLAVGFIGYVFIGSFVTVALAWLWRHKHIVDLQKPLLTRFALLVIAMMGILAYVGYYSAVNDKLSMQVSDIPASIVERTASEAQSGITDKPIKEYAPVNEVSAIEAPNILEKLPFLNPFWREPLVQTAIGLDFARASALGKTWRILQYLVEFCLVVGFFVLLFKPPKGIKLEYMAMVITSFFVLAGLYMLSTYSYGMGVVRIWQITLLFMSPCFVLGAGTIGEMFVRLGIWRKHTLIKT